MCRDDKSGKRCIFGIRCLYGHADGVRSNFSAGSRKEGTQGTVAVLNEIKSKVVYLKTQIQ